MTNHTFMLLLENRLKKIADTLDVKGKEYGTHDRLHNFKAAGLATRRTPAQACTGMMAKHWVSVLDMVERAADGHPPTTAMIDEKIGDLVNYLILLEALLRPSA